MHDTFTSLGMLKPGTDYYGRDYGNLAYQEHDVYDVYEGYSSQPYDYYGPGPYPSHAYVDLEEGNTFLNDLELNQIGQSEELNSEVSGEYPSPVIEHPQFDPALMQTYIYGHDDEQDALARRVLVDGHVGPGGFVGHVHRHVMETQPGHVSEHEHLDQSLSSSPEHESDHVADHVTDSLDHVTNHVTDFSGHMTYHVTHTPPLNHPTPPTSDSDTPPPSDISCLLPRNVALAQKPSNKPLLPTDPQSAVSQLYACPSMWEKACHTKKGVFICTNCHHNGKPLSFRTMIELAVHFDSHGLMRKSKCEQKSCPWSVVGFSTRSEKNRHTKSQHSDLNFPCQTCGRRFGRCDSLKRHMKLVHDIVVKKGVKGKVGKDKSGPKKHVVLTLDKVGVKEEVEAQSHVMSCDAKTKEEPSSPPLKWTSPQGYYSFITRS